MLKACSSLSAGDIFITLSQLKSSGLKVKTKQERKQQTLSEEKIPYHAEYEVMDMKVAT